MSNHSITFSEYKKHLSPYPIFGDMEVFVSKEKDGYKIIVIDKDICTYTDADGKEQTEDMSHSVVTMYTDEKGVIGFIEHGFQAITKANKDLVIHTAMFIGKQISDIHSHINHALE